MRHPSTKELFKYWNERRGSRAAPDRGDIEPSAIRKVLADTFILSFNEASGHPFRISGTRICAAFGRELKNERFLDLWSEPSRRPICDLIGVVSTETIGALASARALSTADTTHDVELLLLPLTHRGSAGARVLGVLAPRDAPYWLGACTLGPLALDGLRYLGAAPVIAPPIAPVRPEGRIRHGFVVYDGGRV